MIHIERMTRDTLALANADWPAFPVVGRAIPRLEDGAWSIRYAPAPPGGMKRYPAEDYAPYLDRADKQVFLAMTEAGECAGMLAITAAWNGYGWIDQLYVREPWRGKGVAKALFGAGRAWAREKDLMGLGLETQDSNLPACRFYARMGMALGGVNTMLYKGFGDTAANEAALYWYLLF